MRRPVTLHQLTDPADVAAGLAGLMVATRRVMHASALTNVDNSAVMSATVTLNSVADALEADLRRRTLRLPVPRDMPPGQLYSAGDPVCGLLNPVALPLNLYLDAEGVATARITVNALFEGPVDSVHGGYSAMLMDGLLGHLLRAHEINAVTGTLSLRYIHRTPIDTPVVLSARVVERTGRKIIAEGTISADGEVTVEGTGLFIALE